MGERKVLNKYIPADFDPSLVPRGKKLSSKDGTVPVRMMLPFSVQCATCNTFLYRGRKFNSKKEPVSGPNGRYLGIQRFRFYIKCTHCSRPITFCTDPKNADYEMESGGTRNYEVYKDKEQTEEQFEKDKEEEEKVDHMKALENRVLDSQREMQDLDNLEEIKAMNRRHIHLLSGSGGFDSDARALLDKIEANKSSELENKDAAVAEKGTELTEEDEALIKSIKFGRQPQDQHGAPQIIKRLGEEDERRMEEQREKEIQRFEERQREVSKTATAPPSQKMRAFPAIKVKRKRPTDAESNTTQLQKQTEGSKKSKSEIAPNNSGAGGLASLLGGYGSDSDSD